MSMVVMDMVTSSHGTVRMSQINTSTSGVEEGYRELDYFRTDSPINAWPPQERRHAVMPMINLKSGVYSRMVK